MTYDGSKSLGERLYEAFSAERWGLAEYRPPWSHLLVGDQSHWETIALTFTASLSDASPKPSSDEQGL